MAPEFGGEDVFVHVNDLLDDKALMVPGRTVQFTLDQGDRGPKASQVTVEMPGTARSRAEPRHVDVDADDADADDMCDVLSVADLEHELTEMLLHVVPGMPGSQILEVRKRVVALAQSHGWVDR